MLHVLCDPASTDQIRLIKRATIMGRLFYHTAMTLLAQINPLQPVTSPEMASMQLTHAHQICGIVAHVKDRGVASAALRCMAIAAEVLVDRREQEEVLQVFDKIRKETGWQIGFLYNELKVKWGWNREQAAVEQQTSLLGAISGNSSSSLSTSSGLPPAPPATTAPPKIPAGIPNPLYRNADFSLPNHPYQQYYQPPNQVNMSNLWF